MQSPPIRDFHIGKRSFPIVVLPFLPIGILLFWMLLIGSLSNLGSAPPSEGNVQYLRLVTVRRWLDSEFQARGLLPATRISGQNGASHSWRVACQAEGDHHLMQKYNLSLPWFFSQNISSGGGGMMSISKAGIGQFAGVFAVETGSASRFIEVDRLAAGAPIPIAFACSEQSSILWNEPSDDLPEEFLRNKSVLALIVTGKQQASGEVSLCFTIENVPGEDLMRMKR